LISECGRAVWTTSWPFAEYVRHAWPGAWVNSLFRNEGDGLSSDLIRQAIAATRSEWPDIPVLGIVTFRRFKKSSSQTRPRPVLLAGWIQTGRKNKERIDSVSNAAE
jgi:hypothetical protein